MEDLENNLKKTQEKISKQKEKEKLKSEGKKATPTPTQTPTPTPTPTPMPAVSEPTGDVIKPTDIEIKVKKDDSAPSTAPVPSPAPAAVPSPAVATPPVQKEQPQDKVIKPEDIEIKIKNETQKCNETVDSCSAVDKVVEEMEKKKEIDNIKKQIKKEKQEEKKAQAKKEAILKLLKPQTPESKKKPSYSKGETTEAEKTEDIQKRNVLENISDEISKINETKEASAADAVLDTPTVAPVAKAIVEPVPKVTTEAANPLGKEERDKEVEEKKKGIEIEITGDEDIDENLFYHNRLLSKL